MENRHLFLMEKLDWVRYAHRSSAAAGPAAWWLLSQLGDNCFYHFELFSVFIFWLLHTSTIWIFYWCYFLTDQETKTLFTHDEIYPEIYFWYSQWHFFIAENRILGWECDRPICTEILCRNTADGLNFVTCEQTLSISISIVDCQETYRLNVSLHIKLTWSKDVNFLNSVSFNIKPLELLRTN